VARRPGIVVAARYRRGVTVPAADGPEEPDGPGEPDEPDARRRIRYAFLRSVRVSPASLAAGLVALSAVIVLVVYVSRLPQRIADSSQFHWGWAVAAALVAPVVYLGNAVSLWAAARRCPPFGRTVQLGAAEALTLLVTPANMGSATIRIRFLSRTGLDQPAAAAATGIYTFLTTVVSTTAVAISTAVAAKTIDADALAEDLPSSQWHLFVIGGALAVATVVAVRAPATRRRMLRWLTDAARYLRAAVADPRSATMITGGELLTMSGQVGCLALLLLAVGASVNVAVLVILTQFAFTATTAVPVPGGLGIPDAILIAGLVSSGTNRQGAIIAAFGYRLLTYWLPSLPGAALLYDLYRRRLV